MSFPIRRTLQELAVLYRLNPSLRDVYVEGPSDRAFFDYFLRSNGVDDASVREVGGLDIPARLVLDEGLDVGNRGRVIALDIWSSRELGQVSACITCIADRDFETFLGRTFESHSLLLTDYACMEMYFFNAAILGKFLGLVIRDFPKSAENLMRDIRGSLEELFVLRMANYQIRLNLSIIPFQECLRITDDGVELALEDYAYRLLNASGKMSERQRFLSSVTECRKRLDVDPRLQINGDDFIAMLSWYIRQHKTSKFARADFIARALITCADFKALAGETMLSKLLKRAFQE